MKRYLFLISLVVLGLVSCNSSKNMVKLTDVKWVLETLDGNKPEMKESGNEVFIRLNGTEKRISGMAGCNRFFGNYEMEGKKLKFSHMGSTRMACPDMEIESVFFKMLEDTDSFVIKDNKLSLMQKGKVLAVFKSDDIKESKK